MTRLPELLDKPPSGRAAPVWFDSLAYCQAKLLGGAAVPWAAPGELTAFYGKAQSMFGSDGVLIDLGALYETQVSAALRTAMTARTRTGYALRTMLGDEDVRSAARAAVAAIVATAGPVPVVLTVPAPGRWLRAAAGDPGGPVDADLAETGSMYVADLLRAFGDSGVDGLLLNEGQAADSPGSKAYRPVLNIAEHYGWPVLLRSAGVVKGEGRSGTADPPFFWDETGPPSGFLLVTVPADAAPEAVMRRIRRLG